MDEEERDEDQDAEPAHPEPDPGQARIGPLEEPEDHREGQEGDDDQPDDVELGEAVDGPAEVHVGRVDGN